MASGEKVRNQGGGRGLTGGEGCLQDCLGGVVAGGPGDAAADEPTDEAAEEPAHDGTEDEAAEQPAHDEAAPTTPPPDAGDGADNPGPDGPPIV